MTVEGLNASVTPYGYKIAKKPSKGRNFSFCTIVFTDFEGNSILTTTLSLLSTSVPSYSDAPIPIPPAIPVSVSALNLVVLVSTVLVQYSSLALHILGDIM